MIKRLLDKIAPLKTKRSADSGYRRLLRWAALPVTDRRWAAPLSAVALGFGLFAGVAIGPGASGTFAGGVPQIIEIPWLAESSDDGEEETEEEAEEPALAGTGSAGGEEESEEGTFTPLVAPETGFEVPGEGAETPATAGPEPEEEASSGTEEDELVGTVVHVNTAAGSYTVVESGGVMSAVHAGKLPKAGTQVKVPISSLANGTLAEAGKRIKTGKQARTTLAGIVTSVDTTPSSPSYAVSNRGASVLIHVHPDPSALAPALPALGAYTSVAVEIETRPTAASSSKAPPGASASAAGEPPVFEPEAEPPPPAEPQPPAGTVPAESAPQPASPAPVVPAPTCAPDPAHPPVTAEPPSLLWQRQASGGGAPFTHSDFAGVLTAICPSTSQLMLSADDIRESGRDILLSVPTGIDPSKLSVGESILASADIAADGTLTLKGLASDEHRKGADDAKATQGDLVPAKKPKN